MSGGSQRTTKRDHTLRHITSGFLLVIIFTFYSPWKPVLVSSGAHLDGLRGELNVLFPPLFRWRR